METTIIEILDTISKGEEPPKKIIYREEIYEYDEQDGDYRNQNYEGLFDYYEITDILNNKVIILEKTVTFTQEVNKIEQLKKLNNEEYILYANESEIKEDIIRNRNKIIELIDKVNSL